MTPKNVLGTSTHPRLKTAAIDVSHSGLIIISYWFSPKLELGEDPQDFLPDYFVASDSVSKPPEEVEWELIPFAFRRYDQ